MSNNRKYNFSPGPAQLPESVLVKIKEELLNWHDSGCSIMEHSHRGAEFLEVFEAAKSTLKELLGVPDNYQILFLQGGASAQFANIPLNFAEQAKGDYAVTGQWSKKAYAAANSIDRASLVYDAVDSDYFKIADFATWSLNPEASYVHVVSNETIGGLQLKKFPEHPNLIADMSSDILSRPVDVSKFAMIYAGAQKNLGIAGVTVVIIRDDLLAKAASKIPAYYQYTTHAKADSAYNTPPTFAIYVLGEVLKWLKDLGGLSAIYKQNQYKAKLLYDFIDNSGFYSNPIDPEFRSPMNVPFLLTDPEQEQDFLIKAQAIGLLNLKGHRSVGGMRASIYNAMPIEGVESLVSFMKKFIEK